MTLEIIEQFWKAEDGQIYRIWTTGGQVHGYLTPYKEIPYVIIKVNQ